MKETIQVNGVEYRLVENPQAYPIKDELYFISTGLTYILSLNAVVDARRPGAPESVEQVIQDFEKARSINRGDFFVKVEPAQANA